MTQPWRFSHLRAFGRSPMHGQHARLQDMDASRDMERGEAVHAITFGTKSVVGYDGVRRGKAYDEFAQNNRDSIILPKAEYDKAREMARLVREHPVAAPLLQGVTEQTMLFRWMGLDCRATPDVRGKGFLTELKTSKSADPNKFIWHARRMCYHAQMRFQGYACQSKALRIDDHWIVCIESDAPFPITVFHVEPEALEEGEKLLTLWAERAKACTAANNYPAYADCAMPLVWPKDDFTLEYEEAA